MGETTKESKLPLVCFIGKSEKKQKSFLEIGICTKISIIMVALPNKDFLCPLARYFTVFLSEVVQLIYCL